MKWSLLLVAALFATVLVFGCVGISKKAPEKQPTTQPPVTETPSDEVSTTVEDVGVTDIEEPGLTEDDLDLGDII